MDLIKSGKLLSRLRKEKGMTQKQVAEQIGVLPKTVSKWETGNGFPDVSVVSSLADVLGVSERILLSGQLTQNMQESGNMKKTKFYLCPRCGSMMQGTGEFQAMCCGMTLEALKSRQTDEPHAVCVSETEQDFYITFSHPMTKEHFIVFAVLIGCDRVLTVRMYPEQDAAVCFPKMYRGKLLFYCNQHGLLEYKI
ncbi:MAG: helix-turn-helix domain-containing protein [Ruminococcaceae bacterium]|nr:helix-turn-helix domain-containing protein [Oscillospiraceae bacterium]